MHAGLLADTRRPEHLEQLVELGIAPFELLVSNLYPFSATVASGATPGRVRRADRRRRAGDGPGRGEEPRQPGGRGRPGPLRLGAGAGAHGGFELDDRRLLAVEAFRHTAAYDIAVASWLGNVLAPEPGGGPFPSWVGATGERSATLRYGENPHQAAALYVSGAPGLAAARQLHGKEMSYNNYVDADAAWRAAHDQDGPCVAIIKHANPCGIAVGADIADAHRKAHACDPVSAFGGVIAANREVSVAMAEQVAEVFTEVVLAPVVRRRGAGRAGPQEEHAGAAAGRPGAAASARSCGRSPAGCCCSSATRSTRPATTRRAGRWPPAIRCPTTCWPTWPSPGGPAGR